jgi:DNA-binding MarR family transcriptional regulator
MSDPEPFYMPDPDLFGHADAYRLYTRYAAQLEEAGLVDRFPPEAELRNIVIELLAERSAVEDLVEGELYLIDSAIVDAEVILEERRNA